MPPTAPPAQNVPMDRRGWQLFDTALGCCGVAWGERGLRSALLPPADNPALRRRLARHAGTAGSGVPPPAVQRAIDGIRALFEGRGDDLRDVVLDFDGIAPFEQRVYTAARAIGPGRTTTYGELAAQLGDRSLARAVGQALARNRFAPVVPCHRVLAAGGRPGGFSAPGGLATKLQLLQIERARLGSDPGLFDDL
jgi:methylated-DNA-[protein]-cysteine S-methyltransferase